MKTQGAETGHRVRPISEPLKVYRIAERGDDVEVVAARFRWVPPRVNTLCLALAEHYMGYLLRRAPTPALVEKEHHLFLLSWSLRVDDGSYAQQVFPFPPILGKDALTLPPMDSDLFQIVRDCDIHARCPQADLLWEDYSAFERNEFPAIVTDEQWEKLLEDAKKKPLLTLLSELGYWRLLRLARGLALGMASSTPGNTSAG